MIYCWYKGEAITNKDVAEALLKLYNPTSDDYKKYFKFPVVQPGVGDPAPTHKSSRKNIDLWHYNEAKTVRIWNDWMGDIQVLASNGAWRSVTPFWSGKSYRVNVKGSDPSKRTTMSIFQFVAIKYGLAEKDIKCIPADGDETNLRFDNIFHVHFTTNKK